jgi:hypothetical protein
MFIKVNTKWYTRNITNVPTAAVHAHVANGEMVIFMDDIVDFCYTMKVKMEDITLITKMEDIPRE